MSAVPPASSLQSVGHRNKDKSRSVEDALLTKFYFKGSIFLKESIDDVNEVWREKNEHSEIKGRGDHESAQFILFFLEIYTIYIYTFIYVYKRMSPVNLTHHAINFEKNFFANGCIFQFSNIISSLIQHLILKERKCKKCRNIWL